MKIAVTYENGEIFQHFGQHHPEMFIPDLSAVCLPDGKVVNGSGDYQHFDHEHQNW